MMRVSWLLVALLLLGLSPARSDETPSSIAKLHPRLRGLMREGAGGSSPLRVDRAGRVHVLIRLEPMNAASTRRLYELGCTVERVRRDLVQARVPLHALPAVAALRDVRSVRPIDGLGSPGVSGARDVRDVDVDEVRRLFRVSGRRVRVGVVSIGIRGLAESVAAGHLPPARVRCRAASRTITRGVRGCEPGERLVETDGGVIARSFRSDGDLAPAAPSGAEGTAALELVHRVAPYAELWFANPETELDYLAAVESLARDVDILVSDIVTHGHFPDGRSIVSETVAEILARRDTRTRAFVQPIGNRAQGHYAGAYIDAASHGGPRGHHLFASDAATEGPPAAEAWNRITVPRASAISIFLTWQPNHPGAGYRLMLVACDSGRPLGSDGGADDAPPEPPDSVWYVNPSATAADVCYAIRGGPGVSAPAVLNVTIADPGGRAVHRFNTPSRSLLVPADTRADIIVVGAVSAADPDRIEPFSSRGPTFDGRAKPDVVWLNRLAVSGAGGYAAPFVGTSASAAHLGGIAALLVELDPGVGRAELADVLRRTAVPLDGANVSGAGRVDPLAAARALAASARR